MLQVFSVWSLQIYDVMAPILYNLHSHFPEMRMDPLIDGMS